MDGVLTIAGMYRVLFFDDFCDEFVHVVLLDNSIKSIFILFWN